MSIDFFNDSCQESQRTDSLFGICDDENGQKAYTDIKNKDKWIGIVINKDGKQITFTAIDHCIEILKPGSKDKESTCDGMLISGSYLFLVELKIQGTKGWESKAIDQLENTIKLLNLNSDLRGFRYKKAFACNKKYPYFHETDNERNLRFFRQYGFRFHVGADITF